MRAWTIRFHGGDERETLASADAFFLANRQTLGIPREEFFARLLLEDEGREAAFVASAEPLWKAPPDGAGYGERPVLATEAPDAGVEGEEELDRPAPLPEDGPRS